MFLESLAYSRNATPSGFRDDQHLIAEVKLLAEYTHILRKIRVRNIVGCRKHRNAFVMLPVVLVNFRVVDAGYMPVFLATHLEPGHGVVPSETITAIIFATALDIQ
jgi:hypothetical protein